MKPIDKLHLSRMHQSWADMIPVRNFDHLDENDETFEAYAWRIQKSFPNIPKDVLKQWMFLHIYNPHMIDNYGWINFGKVIFSEVDWSHEQIIQIQIYSKFSPYVQERSKTETFSGFMCVQEDKEFWKNQGTWRVPIIVLKTENLSAVPKYSELKKPYQLVEGHSRLGYYLAFFRYCQKGLVKMAKAHKVFLMEVA